MIALPIILCAAKLAIAPPDGGRALSALLTYQTRTLGADGVTHETRHQDRFYREGAHVWIERVLPARAGDLPASNGHEIDLSHVARHVQPGPAGAVRVELVAMVDRLVIDVAPVELTRVEVNDRWADAWYLLPPSWVQSLRPTGEHAPADSRWLERRQDGEIVRVLWSDTLGFPLMIERTRSDGSRQATVKTTVIPLPEIRPWARATGFRHKDFADFGD